MKIEHWIPGIKVFRTYRSEWLGSDILAGLSVAAVALPVGIAYAQLGGFDPVIGIYACILPAVAYALFGTSRQLVVNPDAAAITIVASTLTPLAGGDPEHYLELSIVLSFLTGVLCIMGGFLRLGVIANFLSKPILTGYLNGIALSIIASQTGTLLGIELPSDGFFKTVYHAFSNIGDIQPLTLGFGLALLVLLALLKKYLPKWPYALIGVAVAGILVSLFQLQKQEIAVIGNIPSGFPAPKIPSIKSDDFWPLLSGAAGLVLVSFCSMMTTARSFADKGGYEIDANKDMIALGISDIMSGISRGFVISGADSRTAVADASGGKSQLASIVAAGAMALVLLFLTQPLSLVPKVALAATLIVSSISLFDFNTLLKYRKISQIEFQLSIVATLGVMTVGVLPGVLIAVGLTFFQLLRITSKPHDVLLGITEDNNYLPLEKEGVKPVKGLVIYRFEASLLFFNAAHFSKRIKEHVEKEAPQWVIIDAESIPLMDITSAKMLDTLHKYLSKKGIALAIARSNGYFDGVFRKSHLDNEFGKEYTFRSLQDAVKAFGERKG